MTNDSTKPAGKTVTPDEAKRPYAKPTLTVHGTVQELTKTVNGPLLDVATLGSK